MIKVTVWGRNYSISLNAMDNVMYGSYNSTKFLQEKKHKNHKIISQDSNLRIH
jgi:hypothetical protein